MTLTLTLALALALTNLTRWTSRRLEHQCGRHGPALGPGPTSPWAGPAAAARLWLSYQGNCGVSGQMRARVTLCLCGRRGDCFRVRPGAAQLYIYCITYQYDVFAVPSIYIVHYTVCASVCVHK